MASIEKIEQENKSLKVQNENTSKKTNNIGARNEGPHHPDEAIEAKGDSATNKAVKGVGDQRLFNTFRTTTIFEHPEV